MKNYKEFVSGIGKDKLILMAAAGVVLLLCSMPEYKKEEQSEMETHAQEKTTDTSEYLENLETKLEDMIGRMEGVTSVSVMITLKNGQSKEILKDESITSEDTKESDSSGGERNNNSYSKKEDTIYYKNSAGEELPYVLAEYFPQVEGVAVVLKGSDSFAVKEKIIQLIKALFGIEINKIMVTV